MRHVAWIRVATLFAAALSLATLAAAADRPRNGQWVWSAADRDRFTTARRERADLVPAIWVATIDWRDGAVAMRKANAPTLVPDASNVALVVRFDDGFHAAWDSDADRLATQVADKLTALLTRCEQLGVRPLEIQLDYDAPVRRLRQWATLLHRLHDGALAGRAVWITSLPAHMSEPRYGAWLRGAVDGHILQLFDTGPALGSAAAERLADTVAAQRLPFRVGVGTFERRRRGAAAPATEHGAWIAALPLFARQPGFGGVWVFPAGLRWSPALLAHIE
ncbi:MAG: DUF3142 domain-containing protein [Deltaproteobacteria bacterium]|nr:DUF3142 domain-containing protein [Deltaproteobacteria bacterium]